MPTITKLTEKPLYTDRVLQQCYQGVKKDTFTDNRSFDAIEKKVAKDYGEGARGVVTVGGFVMGMWIGHAMSFEVSKGKMLILDPQVNCKYESFNAIKTSDKSSILNIAQPQYTCAYRLDHLDVNFDGMNIACAQRTAGKQ